MARANNKFIKNANVETEFTAENIAELKMCAADPVYFIKNYVKIQHPTSGAIPFNLYPFQEKLIRSFQNNDFNIVLASRQVGKALDINTQLPTPSGWTTMEDIKAGDQVLSTDGSPIDVLGVSDVMYDRVCYEVVFDTNDSIIADAEHLWEVIDQTVKGPNKTKVLTTKQMVDTKYIFGSNQAKYAVKTTKPLTLPQKELPIDPYTLGVWLGDGTSRTGEITTHRCDLEIHEHVDQSYDTYQRAPSEDHPDVCRTTLYGLRTKLREAGLIQNKHIPIEYKRASYDQRVALLQGLMDTDGTVSKQNGVCNITLSHTQLIHDVYELITSIGLKPRMTERTIKGFTRYEINFTAFSDTVEVFKLKRKLNLMKSSPHPTRLNSTKKRSIQRINLVESVPVKCIRVDSADRLFLAGTGLIPTHNSITSASYLLWYAIFNFDKTVLIASNKNAGAMEMIYRIRFAYESLPHWLKPGVMEDGYNKHALGFDNGSRIVSAATSEDTGRGMSISLLFLDEFAFVAPGIQDEFWTAIKPTLSTGGSCIIASTPNGDMNIFAQIWRAAAVKANSFVATWVKWDEPPGRDEKFKEKEISDIGERKWMQEYECIFLSSDALLINSLFLANLTKLVEKITPLKLIKDVIFWDNVIPGETYLVGVDPATGNGEDFSVITVFHFPSLIQVAEYRSNTMSTNDLYGILKNVLIYLEKQQTSTYFSIENNGVGEGVIALYEADEKPPALAEFISEEGKGKRGMTTTSRTKMRACVNLKEMLEKNNLHIKSKLLLSELKAYVRTRGAYAAQSGSTDDIISSVLIIIRLVEEIASYDQSAFDKLYTADYDEWSQDDYDGYDGGYDDNDEGLPMLM